MATNPNNAIGTNGAYGGRTSVNAFNDVLGAFSRGILNGWACVPNSGLTVSLGGNGTTRDVAVAEDNAGNRTTINNISGSPVDVTLSAAPATNSRIDAVVAYVDNPPTGDNTTADNPAACGIIAVDGVASASPVPPNDSAIRTAITADGASGTTAYYVVLSTVAISNGTTDIVAGDISGGPAAGFFKYGFDYSLSEIATGCTWIDGKQIYKKTVDLGQCPNQSSKTVTAGIAGMDKMIRLEGMAYSSTAVFHFGPSSTTFYPDTLELGGGSWYISYQKSDDTILLTTGLDRSNCTAYATVYYTKN